MALIEGSVKPVERVLEPRSRHFIDNVEVSWRDVEFDRERNDYAQMQTAIGATKQQKQWEELRDRQREAMAQLITAFPPSMVGRPEFWGERPTAVALPPLHTEAIAKPDTATSELDEYAALARELGISTQVVNDERLKAVLAEECIPVYDMAAVKKYMDSTVNNEKARGASLGLKWIWTPLRKSDAGGGNCYVHPVPLPVLLTVKKLVDRLGTDSVEFFVTDYEVVKPDPFLAVRAKGSQTKYVIERWDEPSFRG
jgi:hypothetical protein